MRAARAVTGLVAVTLAWGAAPALGASSGLDAYRVDATPENLRVLQASGFDVGEGRDSDRATLDVVGTAKQLRAVGVEATEVTDHAAAGAANRRAARAGDATAGASDAPFDVWAKYDAVAGDDKEQYAELYDRLAAEKPAIVKKRVWGTTYEGREIVGLQVTKDATGSDVPGRPAVLYNAMQHAREWLAGTTCRQTLEYVVDNYGKTTSSGLEVTRLVDENELWFVCVNNPDGYEFTFTPGNRLWRKNLRDNDGDGTITGADGVDPNRNFSANWGRDDEGSSPAPDSETYRGPSPGSEPETKAMEALFGEVKPVFQKNDHTAAELLLYPQGFQQDTPTADNEIFTALAGDPFTPGIEGYLPELSAGLYITNGDFTDWAYSSQRTLSFTPEGTAAEDPDVTGFEFPDSPLQVRQEFLRHLPFALDLAEGAGDPADLRSHIDRTPRDFVVSTFDKSYGDPQVVQATVKRELGDVVLRYRINGGRALEVDTKEWQGEKYFKDDAVYFHRVRGVIAGTQPGDEVEAWFAAGGKESERFTYRAVNETDNPVLLLSDEDWSGVQPAPAAAGPTYLDTYKALLDQVGVTYDVFDVADGRKAPDALGVLGHYSHVVWYTGDDYVPRAPDAPGGSGIDKVAVDTQNRVRDFLNEGGKLFYTGQNAGRVFAEGYPYNPFQQEERQYCQAGASRQCISVQDDFLQYWLGAHSYLGAEHAPVEGATSPFEPRRYEIDPESHVATFLTMSSIYDPERYPQWAGSKKVLTYDRPGPDAFGPFDGEQFLAAGTDDEAYKRLLHEVDLTGVTAAQDAKLEFAASYDLEGAYDYLFVELHSKGEDDWTTLADANGHTDTDTGDSCPATTVAASNWQSLHPFLTRYQTKSDSGETCEPTGTTGEWNAATGASGGWQQWSVPIPPQFRGKVVEVSITVASDPATLGLGVWIDKARLTVDGADRIPPTSFEGDLGGWTTPGPPEGTENQVTGWTPISSVPFVETPGVVTEDTVYTGFGLEKIAGAEHQVALLRDVFEHLGATSKPRAEATRARPVGGPPATTPPAGAPPATTPPGQGAVPPPKAGPKLRFLLFDKQRLRTVRARRGVYVTAQCAVACTVTYEVRLDPAVARRLKLRSFVVGRRTVPLGTAPKSTRVRFSASAERRVRRLRKVRYTVVAIVSGERRTAVRTLR